MTSTMTANLQNLTHTTLEGSSLAPPLQGRGNETWQLAA